MMTACLNRFSSPPPFSGCNSAHYENSVGSVGMSSDILHLDNSVSGSGAATRRYQIPLRVARLRNYGNAQ